MPKGATMKKLIFALTLLALLLPLALAAKVHQIEGYWYNAEKTTKIQIYKTTGGSYAGKIVWLKEPNDAKGVAKLDVKNPDKKLRGRALMNLVILTGLKSKGNDKFDGGKIYDPKSGNTYSCKGELENINTLKLRGFVGVSLIGRTDTWTRAK